MVCVVDQDHMDLADSTLDKSHSFRQIAPSPLIQSSPSLSASWLVHGPAPPSTTSFSPSDISVHSLIHSLHSHRQKLTWTPNRLQLKVTLFCPLQHMCTERTQSEKVSWTELNVHLMSNKKDLNGSFHVISLCYMVIFNVFCICCISIPLSS